MKNDKFFQWESLIDGTDNKCSFCSKSINKLVEYWGQVDLLHLDKINKKMIIACKECKNIKDSNTF